MFRGRIPVFVLLVGGILLALSGCATYSTKLDPLRRDYGAGAFASADSTLNALIAAESGVDVKVVAKSDGLDDSIKPAKGDTVVLLLEKAQVKLALGQPDVAVKLLRRARDVLDANFVYDTGSFIRDFTTLLRDDTSRKYSGADYDHLMVRALLAVADLMAGGGDAYAYAVQLGEKQEEIIGSPLGEIKGKKGFKPRETYRRVSFGAYVQGLIREEKMIFDEAGRAYERALSFEGGDHPVYGPALKRIKSPTPMDEPRGTLVVFDFAGEGPHLIEERLNPSSDAVDFAAILLLNSKDSMAFLTQAPVPVPKVFISDPNPPPLAVSVGSEVARTEKVLDVNKIAWEQNQANMGWIAGRAMARRAAKLVASRAVGEAVSKGGGRKSGTGELMGALATIATSVAMTATENADTRSWSTLPAEIRTARLELPPGVHKVKVGATREVEVRVAPGHASYLLVIRPSPAHPPAVFADRLSRP